MIDIREGEEIVHFFCFYIDRFFLSTVIDERAGTIFQRTFRTVKLDEERPLHLKVIHDFPVQKRRVSFVPEQRLRGTGEFCVP